MRNKLKGILSVMAASMVFSAVPHVSAGEVYDTYNYDRWGEAIPSQTGYRAERSVSGKDLGTDDFSSPSDIFRAPDGMFYIADSGNGRIVMVDSNFEKAVGVIKKINYNGNELSLSKPKSVFVAEGGIVYIADTENSRIIRCTQDGTADLVIEKPSSELYDAVTFLPQKVLADDAGYIYTVVDNITSGSVMFDSSGNFTGFYGANRVQQTGEVIRDHFWKLFAGEGMRRYMTNSVPAAITSFDIDEDGFIYTCNSSTTQEVDSVKKVNAAGYNLFADIDVYFGDRPTADYSNFPNNSYVDIDVSPEGFINCLDYNNGRIFQYDEDCNLLFIFGGKGYQLGTFRQVSAIESSSDRIYVADSQKNTITVFSETVFGENVHRATLLYNDGYYEEALEPWFEVLKRDGNYRRAYIGISSAYINQGKYSEAMKYAKLADSQKRYNRAFEGWREEFINRYFLLIALTVLLLVCLTAVLKHRHKKKHVSITESDSGISEKQWVSHAVFHPFEGFEDMRWKKSGSLKISFFIIFLFFAGTICRDRLYAFHFWNSYDRLFNIVPYIVKSIVMFAAWVVGNWAVCTLFSGEGTLKRICIFSAYSLVPYVASLYVSTLLSHFLVTDEGVFIMLIQYGGIIWSALLMFNAVKTVHQYSVPKTAAAVILTVAAMLIMMFLLVLVMSLFQKVGLFLYSLYTELQYRFRV